MPDPSPDQEGPEGEEGSSRDTADPVSWLRQAVGSPKEVGKVGTRISPYVGLTPRKGRGEGRGKRITGTYREGRKTQLLQFSTPDTVTASRFLETGTLKPTDTSPTHTRSTSSGSDLASTGCQR